MSSTIYESVYNLLATEITDVNGRVFPSIIPLIASSEKTKFPAIIYENRGTIPHKMLWEATDSVTMSFEITTLSDDHNEAATISQKVREAIDQHNGPDGEILIELIRYDDEDELYEEDAKVYEIIQQYDIFWRKNN